MNVFLYFSFFIMNTFRKPDKKEDLDKCRKKGFIEKGQLLTIPHGWTSQVIKGADKDYEVRVYNKKKKLFVTFIYYTEYFDGSYFVYRFAE